MDENHGSDEAGEKALAKLCSLVNRQLLQDSSFVDGGFHIEFHGGAEDFAERVSAAIGQSILTMSKDQLISLLMWKTRDDMRKKGQNVIIDDELPPGFSSN